MGTNPDRPWWGCAGVYVALLIVVVSGFAAFLTGVAQDIPWDMVVVFAAGFGFLTYAVGQAKPVRSGVREIVPRYGPEDSASVPGAAEALRVLRLAARIPWGLCMLLAMSLGLTQWDLQIAALSAESPFGTLEGSLTGLVLTTAAGAIVLSWLHGPPASLLPFATAPALATLGAFLTVVPVAWRLVLHLEALNRGAPPLSTEPLFLPFRLMSLCMAAAVGLVLVFHGRALRELAKAARHWPAEEDRA